MEKVFILKFFNRTDWKFVKSEIFVKNENQRLNSKLEQIKKLEKLQIVGRTRLNMVICRICRSRELYGT